MKKNLLIAILLMAVNMAFAVSEKNVPKKLTDYVKENFPNSKVSYKKDVACYIVTIKEGKLKTFITASREGDIYQVDTQINPQDLPEGIKQKYGDVKYESAILIQDLTSKTNTYHVQFKQGAFEHDVTHNGIDELTHYTCNYKRNKVFGTILTITVIYLLIDFYSK